ESVPLPPTDLELLYHHELTPTAPGAVAAASARRAAAANRDGSTQILNRGQPPEEATMLVDRARLPADTIPDPTVPRPTEPRPRRSLGPAVSAVTVLLLLSASVALLGYKQRWWTIPKADQIPGLSRVEETRNRELDSLLAEARRAA